MLKAGGGTIVVTSSSNALATQAKRSAYTASKRALVGLVQAAALDYALQGIRVNTLIPGTTDTPFLRKAAGMENVPGRRLAGRIEPVGQEQRPRPRGGWRRRQRSLRSRSPWRPTSIPS